jgi:MraZ protein
LFRGAHYHSVDDKGRVIMPLRFRNSLGDPFMLTKGLDGCLFVFRNEDFLELEKTLQSSRALDRHTMRLQRWFSGEAAEGSVDNQGRTAIPANLREFAGIKDDVVIVGVGRRVEVWARERWDAFNSEITDSDIADSATEVKLSF